jgi:DNA-binding response OmpR family regulator
VADDSIDRAPEVRWTQASPASGGFNLPSPNGATQPAKPRLLIVDDDRDLCNLVARYLEPEGFALSAVHRGADGVQSAIERNYELIVLDVMLPDKKGFDVLRELRSRLRTPVLMLTAKGDEFDRVLGLELGADDYLPKPFSPRELVARISAILRRSGWQAEGGIAMRPPVIRIADIELDLAARTVLKAGQPLRLTSAEFDILHAFCDAPWQVHTREALVENVLDRKFSPFDRSIDLHISNLRRKLGPQDDGSERIRSIRGIGYLYAWPMPTVSSKSKPGLPPIDHHGGGKAQP